MHVTMNQMNTDLTLTQNHLKYVKLFGGISLSYVIFNGTEKIKTAACPFKLI